MQAPPETQLRAPTVWPFFLACALAATCIDFGTLHRHHQGDSLLPILESLQYWTPFFWWQDRIGMLVPLLATPFRHPLVNLLVQDAIYVFCGLGAIFLLARYTLRDATYPLVGLCSATAFVALTPTQYQFDFFCNTFYGVWLILGFGALVVIIPRPDGSIPWQRRVVALLLLVLAHWVYSAAALILAPLVLFRRLAFHSEDREAFGRAAVWMGARLRALVLGPTTPASGPPAGQVSPGLTRQKLLARLWEGANSELGVAFSLLAVSLATGSVLMGLFATSHQLNIDTLPPDLWLGVWGCLAQNSWAALEPHYWPVFLGLSLAAGFLLLRFAATRRHAGVAWRAAAALIVAGVLYGAFMGTRTWVLWGSLKDYYWKPSIFLIQAALVMVAVAPLAALLRQSLRNKLSLLAAPLLCLAAVYSFGRPSLAGVRHDLDELCCTIGEPPRDEASRQVAVLCRQFQSTLAASTRDILATQCTHIAGHYWDVWPRVFHANLVLYERGENRVIWGVTFRSEAILHLWNDMPETDFRVAVPLGDMKEARKYLTELSFPPLQVVKECRTISVCRPKAVVRNQSGKRKPSASGTKAGPLGRTEEGADGSRFLGVHDG